MGTLVFVCPTSGFEVFTGLEMDHEQFRRAAERFTGHSLSPLSQTASTVRRDRLAGRRRASNRRDRFRRNCHTLELRRSLYPGYAAEQHTRTCAHPTAQGEGILRESDPTPRLSPRTRLVRKSSINPALRLLQSFTLGWANGLENVHR